MIIFMQMTVYYQQAAATNLQNLFYCVNEAVRKLLLKVKMKNTGVTMEEKSQYIHREMYIDEKCGTSCVPMMLLNM